MKREIKRLLVVAAGVWLLTGCCWTDHSKTIKKVAEPMAKELERFYMEHKRFPTDKERDAMLEKVGCKVDRSMCKYKNKNFVLKKRKTDNYYDLIIRYENTYCPIYLNYNGKVDNIGCLQKPCIDLGQ